MIEILKKHFYFISFFILVFGNLLLNLSTKIYFYPEHYYFAYLVSRGLIPYKDFFDHHGFLLYYLMSPLAADTSFLLFNIFFCLIQVINLSLVLLILRKNKNKLLFFLLGLAYVAANFKITDNTFWYEEVIPTLLLLTYYLLYLKEFKFKNIVVLISEN